MSITDTIRDIDLAWERINAMGGAPCCAHDHVYNLAINDALRILESLGASDPAPRRRAAELHSKRRCVDCGVYPAMAIAAVCERCREANERSLELLTAENGQVLR